ncbi:endonuclease/exonuclease/phosphatase family protein [Vibrio sp. S9_S30]|nr:endonuclease/exonuclease/phosphatase family protein [Vibrio sp. S9_S30]
MFLLARFFFLPTVIIHFPAASAEFAFSTWNLEWLTTHPSKKIESSQRVARDFNMLNKAFDKVSEQSWHIMSFQEVDSEEALKRVTGPGYQYFLSERSRNKHQDLQFEDINQYTGFAVSEGINVQNRDDINLTPSQYNKLRFATYIVVYPPTRKPIHLLSIHLKSGCFAARKNTKSCKVLAKQGKSLNAWIKERQRNDQSYVILGDFNHNLAYPNDWLWRILTKNVNDHIVLNSKNTKAECRVRSRSNPTKTHQYRNLIDHIVSSPDLALRQAKQVAFTKHDVLNYRLSDHCPLVSKAKL